MARAGSPRLIAVSAKTSRLTPSRTGRRARTRLAAGSSRSENIGRSTGALARACLCCRFFFHMRGPRHGPRTPPAADNPFRGHPLLDLHFSEGGEELGGGGEGGTLEAFHGGADQGPARVMVERDPRPVVEQALLGALVHLEARRPGGHHVGLVEESVELRAAVTRRIARRADIAGVEQ